MIKHTISHVTPAVDIALFIVQVRYHAESYVTVTVLDIRVIAAGPGAVTNEK